MMDLLDNVIGDGIHKGVDHLGEDVFGLDQFHRGGLGRRPHRFPAPVEGVLVLGDQLVKMRQELGQFAFDVDDARVVMVRHGRGEDDLDAVLLGRDGEAIDEGVVTFGGWAQEEATLRTPPRDHVHPTGDDRARKRHAPSSAARPASKINLGGCAVRTENQPWCRGVSFGRGKSTLVGCLPEIGAEIHLGAEFTHGLQLLGVSE